MYTETQTYNRYFPTADWRNKNSEPVISRNKLTVKFTRRFLSYTRTRASATSLTSPS